MLRLLLLVLVALLAPVFGAAATVEWTIEQRPLSPCRPTQICSVNRAGGDHTQPTFSGGGSCSGLGPLDTATS